MASEVERLDLWKVLVDKGTDEQRAVIKKLADEASALLDRVIETFPTYTLHNTTHAHNVARLMGELLGPSLKELTALEAAMLILSAFWHDIGMVFTESERGALESEPYWREFLEEKPEALIAREKAGELSTEIAEWYCRWRHADRVYVHLDKQPPKDLQWGRISFREALGELCRSHNLDVAEIKTHDALQNNYLEEADLKFCAILLRMADILDFDNSRSPEPVYRMLGLERRDTKRKTESDVEWRKHLHSEGFRFPASREGRYQLGFIAGPDHPAVEYDIRHFLNVIENQLEQCHGLLPFCDSRWRDFPLPGEVNRDNIKSNGYRYGEYHFLLDQSQILNLLMGENLYEDRYVFVRELLQNAIDTSRYREYYERVHGSQSFKAKPIRVSEWRDPKGRLWLRIDDYGMGMDEPIIRNHLLKVGSSYYQTAKFRAEVIRARKLGAPNFVPISRFGIGLLSCFIIGDRVEISTWHLNQKGKNPDPIRLSLDGLHGFYTLQTGHMQPLPMPVEDGEETGYRREIGTSVAVRLDPRKESATFNLRSLMAEHVLSSPVPVEFQGEPFGLDYQSLIENPWCQRTAFPLPPEEMARLNELTGYEFSEPLKIEFVPIDLTRHSPSPEFKGQMLTARIQPTEEWLRFVRLLEPFGTISAGDRWYWGGEMSHDPYAFYFQLVTHDYTDRQSFIRKVKDATSDAGDERFSRALLRLLERVETAEKERARGGKLSPSTFTEHGTYRTIDGEAALYARSDGGISAAKIVDALPETTRTNIRRTGESGSSLISHNGVMVPPKSVSSRYGREEIFPLNSRLTLDDGMGYTTLNWGTVALSDSLRPDVDVSRGSLRKVPLAVYSHAVLSLHRALKSVGLEGSAKQNIASFTQLIGKEVPTLGQLIAEGVLTPEAEWLQVPLFRTRGDVMSLNEVKVLLDRGEEVEFYYHPDGWHYRHYGTSGDNYRFSFDRLCAGGLAQLRLNLQIRFDGNRNSFVAVPGEAREIRPGQREFPPLTFLPYTSDAFVVTGCGVNLDHPLSRWLIELTPQLAEHYPGILGQLKSLLIEVNYKELVGEEDGQRFESRDREKFRSTINEILERMMVLERAFRPPKSLLLEEKDVPDPSPPRESEAGEDDGDELDDQ
jgi:hypothetical protein